MYATLYHHPAQLEAADEARTVVTDLFTSYHSRPDLMPTDWADACPVAEPERSRHIADFIAGMTDRYAQKRHHGIFGVGEHPSSEA
jgi:dGTPase